MKPGRTVLAVLGISCGIALWVAISIINESTLGFFRDSVTAVSGKATLTVGGGEAGFDEGIGEKVEKVKGVAHAVPVVETRTWLLSSNESLVVLGVDLLQEKAVRSYKSEGNKKIMSFD
jgi:ABC-type lipoprotein release transport system permease subunit